MHNPNIAKWLSIASVISISIFLQLQWFAFSPIAYEASGYFSMPLAAINNIYIVCFLIYFVAHLFTIFTADRYGPGFNIKAAILFVVLSQIFRVLSSVISPDTRISADDPDSMGVAYIMAFVSSVLAIIAGAMVTIMPAKVASLWFPESQRTFANSMGAMGIQLGLLVTDLIGPLIVGQDASQKQFIDLSLAHLGFALLAITVSLGYLYFSNWTGLPIGCPPTASSQAIMDDIIKKQKTQSIFNHAKGYYVSGILAFKDSRGFSMVTILVAVGLSIGTNLIGATPQIMCPYGYSKEVSSLGVLLSLNIGGYAGVFIMSFVTGRGYVRGDKFIKILGMLGTASIWFCMLIMPTYGNDKLVILAFFLFGITLQPAIPLAHELAVECTYPLGAGLSSGMMNVISDLMGFAMSNLLYKLAKDITDDDDIAEFNTCEIDPDSDDYYPRNFKTSCYIMGAIFTVGCVLFIVLFKCPFLRKKADDLKKIEARKEIDGRNDGRSDGVTMVDNLGFEVESQN